MTLKKVYNNPTRPNRKVETHANILKKKNRLMPGSIEEVTVEKVAYLQFPIFKDVVDNEREFVELYLKTVRFYNHLVKHRGVLQGTKRFKMIRVYTIKWILGLSPEPVPCLSLNKKGFPRDLMHLKAYSVREDRSLRMVLSILNVSRLSKYLGKLRKSNLASIYQNIERDNNFKNVVTEFDKAIPNIFKELKIRKYEASELGDKLKLIGPCSKGPNSKLSKLDSLLSAPFDAKAVVEDYSLSRTLQKIWHLYGKDSVWEYVQHLADTVKPQSGITHSKIALIPDSENKQRIVAMVDYWSQMTLIPLEHIINDVISKVPNNYMFDQDKGRELVRQFTINGEPVSLDGTDFTDRFPREVQQKVLDHLVGPELSKELIRLLVNRSFSVGDNEKVRYAVGQPMGAHASFHLANLTHSVFAIWCCMDTNMDPAESSAVCGDDIAFSNKEPANLYSVRMKSLKMSFSDFKGFHASSTTKVAEFCKKLYLDGNQVNGYTPKPFLNYSRDYKYALSCIDSCSLEPKDALQWVSESRNKYLSNISDLVTLRSLAESRNSYTSVFKSACSTKLSLVLDELDDMTELKRSNILSLTMLGALHVIKTEDLSNIASKIGVYSFPEDILESSSTEEIYSTDPCNGRVVDRSFLQNFVSGKIPHSLVYKYDESEIDNRNRPIVMTPVGFWYYNVRFPHLNEWDPYYATFLEKVRSIKDVGEPIPCADFRGTLGPLIDKVKTSFFTGQVIHALAVSSRLDDRNLMEKTKKQFLISKRMLDFISDWHYANFDISYIHKFFTPKQIVWDDW